MSRAHAKIIWVGEHACMYGCPAIVSDIPLYVFIESGSEVSKESKFVAEFLSQNELPISVTSEFPYGIGLGFSSAKIAAIYNYYVEHYSLEVDSSVENCVKEYEAFTSGVDAFGVTHEGCYFWSNDEVQKLNDVFFPYFLINTGCEDTTSEMLNSVVMEDGFEDCVFEFKAGLNYSDLGLITSSIINAHELLESIGAVDKKASEFIEWLGEEGFAAKISGAGGKTNGSGIVLGIGRLNDVQRSTLSNDFGFDVIYET
jgi:mevalonate kinase